MEEYRPKDEECPSQEFDYGKPSGGCWGDGHYMCETCRHFRKDFVGEKGIQKRSDLLAMQGMPGIAIKIGTIK
jgi:hypothetical protein